jgi:acetyl-CoA carboxylase carboxyltransferase component
MSIQNQINDLNNRRATLEQGGGESAIKKLHADDKLTARERIEKLFDTNSFVEIGAFVKPRTTDFNLSIKEAPADGVVTGYGAVEGKLVYAYSQDATVLGGAIGEMHAKKIASIYDMALKMGAPIVAIIDSAGLRLQESTDGLEGFGNLFLKQSMASGVIPQITAVLGSCGGGASIIPSLSDFTFMTTKNAKLFVNSPNALDDKSADFESYASASFHGEKTGLADFIFESEEICVNEMRRLINLLPANNGEECPLFPVTDDPNREPLELNSVVGNGLDAKTLITSIADNGEVLETKATYAKEVVTAFIKLNGSTVGVVGHQTTETDGALTINGCLKTITFIKFLDAFNIPVVTFTDVTGFEATAKAEQMGISKYVAKMTYVYASATIPKINVIANRAYGSAYVACNSKHIGADFVYAWPNAAISVMDASSAVKIMYADEINTSEIAGEVIANKTAEFSAMQGSPYAAASRGYVDDIIAPVATRKRIIAALEMLYTKSEYGPNKKHGTV